MRMWDVDPKLLCRKHLLGEHVEMHMFAGTIKKGISIQGYIDNGLVNPFWITLRHEQLAEEMTKRGYNHQSDLDFSSYKLKLIPVDVEKNKGELRNRCVECKSNGI